MRVIQQQQDRDEILEQLDILRLVGEMRKQIGSISEKEAREVKWGKILAEKLGGF